ncbi:hypothetical protein FACS189499_10480 [Clostridia bacterium]|nr:hypothetical protein FACS189499_10480 [Clostridia bacterium]
MYAVIENVRFVFINSKLDERMQQLVCAHELGHDALHRDFAKTGALKEFMLYDMKSRPEYEANIFAADILLDGNEVYELACGGYDVEQIARELGTDINLVLIKMSEMNKVGYDFNVPWLGRGDFWGGELGGAAK